MLEGADLAVGIESHQQCKTPLESVQYNNDMSIKDMLLHPLLSLILTTLKLSVLQFVLFSLRGGNEWVFLGKRFFLFPTPVTLERGFTIQFRGLCYILSNMSLQWSTLFWHLWRILSHSIWYHFPEANKIWTVFTEIHSHPYSKIQVFIPKVLM